MKNEGRGGGKRAFTKEAELGTGGSTSGNRGLMGIPTADKDADGQK
jgi:hypothetical protein